MRIIAGAFKGRPLKPPADRRSRPTQDRVREAWFSILQSRIPGARVLDLYAGSGALGLEALSRGADHVDFVEMSRSGLQALRQNIAALDVESRVRVHRADALQFVEAAGRSAYDVVLADPPYRSADAERLAERFRRSPFARVFSVEHPTTLDLAGDDVRRYGETALTFFYS